MSLIAAPVSSGGGYVRPAAMAGAFYPSEAARLKGAVASMLHAAADQSGLSAPKAIIAPHAGYVYSGETAARAYARLAKARGTIRRVVLLGPAHQVHVRGLALPEAEAFDTPLGRISVDQDAVRAISALRQVIAARPVHAAEHSVEVHLPFLLETLDAFTLVPLVIGEATPAMVAEVLDLLWGGPETLIVVSSDLSHYHSYRDAVRIDNATVSSILARDTRISHEQACGATPINALMQMARQRDLQVELIDQCNSGDTAGTRDRVVGYASFAVYDRVQENRDPREGSVRGAGVGDMRQGDRPESLVPQWFPADGGAALVSLARAAIEKALGLAAPFSKAAAWLENPSAVFVTLIKDGALRGCIGSLAVHRALGVDIAENAVAAALCDPRFAAVTAQEFAAIRVEVSLLTAPVALAFYDEPDALAQLRPHRDGLILEVAGHRATFLPQVWEQFPGPRAFLAALKLKAGLSANYWGADVRLSRYSVAKFTE